MVLLNQVDYLSRVNRAFQSTHPSTLTVTPAALGYQFLIQWKEVRHRHAVPPHKEWNAAWAKNKTADIERRGSVGACGGRSAQITGSERGERHGRVVEVRMSWHKATKTTPCSSQTNRTLTFLPLLLDCLFFVEENKFPPFLRLRKGKC